MILAHTGVLSAPSLEQLKWNPDGIRLRPQGQAGCYNWGMDAIFQTLPNLEVPAVLITLVKVTGSAPRDPGARLLALANGSFLGSLGGGRLEFRALAEARVLLQEGAGSLHRTWRLNPQEDQCCGGEVELFFERLAPSPRVVIFGAGHVARAVSRALESLPFRVTVVDERAEFAHPGHFGPNVQVRCGAPLEQLGAIPTDADSIYALIMTHSHRRDLEMLGALLGRPLRYLGLIGSATKWSRFRAALLGRGVSETELARVRCPIGIGVGSKLPEEIAVSVAAELLAVRDGLEVSARDPLVAARSLTDQPTS